MIVCYAAGGVTIQALDKRYPPFQLNFIRITSKTLSHTLIFLLLFLELPDFQI